METFSLEGKTALITGGSRGIGYGVARTFIDVGARAIITARNETTLREAAASLGPNCLAMPCDNSDTDAIAAMVEDAWRVSPIDILVNNAGNGDYYKRAEYVTPHEFDEVMGVNLRGTYFCSIEVAKRAFKAGRPASIINVSSMTGVTPLERLGVYGASKAGIHQFTRVMGLEWADRNVRVNAIAPGWVETDFTTELFASRWGEKLRDDVPMKRFATVDDLTGLILYLASDASTYMTGSIIPIDGGRGLV
jgi:NAD(P)-dependent dehydrogenase (short-subunit alcohol dehydrogenase family)